MLLSIQTLYAYCSCGPFWSSLPLAAVLRVCRRDLGWFGSRGVIVDIRVWGSDSNLKINRLQPLRRAGLSGYGGDQSRRGSNLKAIYTFSASRIIQPADRNEFCGKAE